MPTSSWAAGIEEPAEVARNQLAHHGWAVLRGLPLLSHGQADEDRIMELVSMFGTPSTRDGGRTMWPVTPRTNRGDATFSVRSGAASLHTDSQYRRNPEDVVCLFVVRPAADGGHTLLLRTADAVAAVEQHPRGRQILKTLVEPRWAWKTPDVFPAEPSFQAAVLAEDGRIRWRFDNLAPTLDAQQILAAAVFQACIETTTTVRQLRLGSGDLVIVDNRHTLHGRTSFQDPRRLLLRVRLWAHR